MPSWESSKERCYIICSLIGAMAGWEESQKTGSCVSAFVRSVARWQWRKQWCNITNLAFSELVEFLSGHHDSCSNILRHRLRLTLWKPISSSDVWSAGEGGGSKCDQREREDGLAVHGGIVIKVSLKILGL
jgi:hypothetical protein